MTAGEINPVGAKFNSVFLVEGGLGQGVHSSCLQVEDDMFYFLLTSRSLLVKIQ